MRRLPVTMATVSALLLLSACGGAESNSESTTSTGQPAGAQEITVGLIPIVDVAPLYLGVEQGFFEEENLDVTLELAQGGAAIVPAVMSGSLQFGMSNLTTLIIAQEQGLPLEVVAPAVYTTGEDGEDYGAIVAKDPAIETAADLEGKTVAVNTLKNIGDTSVRASIKAAGGDPDSVELIEVPLPNMPDALESGDVDAIFTVEPFLTIAMDGGGHQVASMYVDVHPDLMAGAYFTSRDVIEEDAAMVEAFVKATERSLDYANENPDEVRRILGTYTQIGPDVIDRLVLPRFDSEVHADGVERLSELMLEDRIITKQADVDALLP